MASVIYQTSIILHYPLLFFVFNANAARLCKRWVQRTLLQAIANVTQEEQQQQCKAAADALCAAIDDILGPASSDEASDEPSPEEMSDEPSPSKTSKTSSSSD